jgi:hypothetical protein
MLINQPYNKIPCQSAYKTNPTLVLYCYILLTTDSAAMPAIIIPIVPIYL